MNLKELLKTYRQDLHQIPELAFDLYKTHVYVKEVLEGLGFDILVEAKTGIIVRKQGLSDEAIAFRSDMDGLPVKEKTGVSFQSTHEHKMHACGHDGHMAMLLGFAHYVASLKNPKKSIVLIFQPAEEGPGGAKLIVDSGIFETYHITSIYGIHLYPNLEEGLYGLVDGPMMARNAEFDIDIKGKSAHAAQPHLGHDAILAASALVQGFNQIVSRDVNPFHQGVISIGTIEGGEARNIIPNRVHLSGTMRSFYDEVHETMKKRMHQVADAVAMMHQVDVNLDVVEYYPAVHNHHDLYLQLKDSLPKESYLEIEPMMFAEDFAFYQKHVPGMFVMLGTRNESLGYVHPLHSCYFNFKEDVLEKGVELYKHILKSNDIIE